MRISGSLTALGGALLALTGTQAIAQSQSASDLLALGDRALEAELTSRYEAGLAASTSDEYITADDPRYLWALEAKAQCAIALGFMKSSTRDETSIGKCVRAHDWMNRAPRMAAAAVMPPPPPPTRRPARCDEAIAGMVFFDFDSAALREDATPALGSVIESIAACGWRSLNVVGHTDQAGSDEYNRRLSRARADAVAAAMRSRNVTVPLNVEARGESEPRVPLADGTRSPQNRRVEISAQ